MKKIIEIYSEMLKNRGNIVKYKKYSGVQTIKKKT